MSVRDCLVQRWRSLLGLSIAGGMLVWGRFLDPSSVEWLDGIYATYWGLCVVASLASIALALQEAKAGRGEAPDRVNPVRPERPDFRVGSGATGSSAS